MMGRRRSGRLALAVPQPPDQIINTQTAAEDAHDVAQLGLVRSSILVDGAFDLSGRIGDIFVFKRRYILVASPMERRFLSLSLY